MDDAEHIYLAHSHHHVWDGKASKIASKLIIAIIYKLLIANNTQQDTFVVPFLRRNFPGPQPGLHLLATPREICCDGANGREVDQHRYCNKFWQNSQSLTLSLSLSVCSLHRT